MNTIALPPICDRAAAMALHADICEIVGAATIAVDASDVEKIGQAMLQTLVAATKSEGGIVIASPSAPFSDAIRLAGLDGLLAENAG